MAQVFLKYLEVLPMELELKNTKVHGYKIKCKDMEFIIMHVELFTMANGKTINTMVKEHINSQMVLFMKESGSNIKCMEQDSILILIAENGKVNIEMENSKLKDKNNSFNKNKFKSENNNQKDLLLIPLITCYKLWLKVIKKL
jgi:hypothetical protein